MKNIIRRLVQHLCLATLWLPLSGMGLTMADLDLNQPLRLLRVVAPHDVSQESSAHPEVHQKKFDQGMEVYRAFVEQAEKGDLEVQLTLARMRLKGEVVPKDQNIAIFWLRQAAKGGLPQAQTLLGQVLLSESSVATSKYPEEQIKEAFAWLYKAAQQSEQQAQYQFSSLILRSPQSNPMGYDKNTAIDFLQACIGNTKYPPCMKLGLEVALGGIPSLRISSQKMHALRLASLNGLADQGNSNAQYLLAFEDSQNSEYWLKMASRSGHPEASYDLAIRVLDGLTSLDEPDLTLLELLEQSSLAGYGPAMQLLGTLLVTGSRFPANMELGQSWLDKAKTLNEQESRPLLGQSTSEVGTAESKERKQ